ncbi:MAG: Holliday junction resolvase-like protein [Brevinematia bacterium]
MGAEVLFTFIIYGISMAFFGAILGYFIAKYLVNKEIQELIKKERKSAINFSRSVLKGKISEQMFPLMPFFKYNMSDARFIGSPIDYIVFRGYSNLEDGSEIKEIVFVEVKTGNSKLSNSEIAVKRAIEDKKVRFEVINIDEKV